MNPQNNDYCLMGNTTGVSFGPGLVPTEIYVGLETRTSIFQFAAQKIKVSKENLHKHDSKNGIDLEILE